MNKNRSCIETNRGSVKPPLFYCWIRTEAVLKRFVASWIRKSGFGWIRTEAVLKHANGGSNAPFSQSWIRTEAVLKHAIVKDKTGGKSVE